MHSHVQRRKNMKNRAHFSSDLSISHHSPRESVSMSSMATRSISRVDRSMMWENSTSLPSKSRKILVSNRRSHSSLRILLSVQIACDLRYNIFSCRVDISQQMLPLWDWHSTHSNSQSEKNGNTSIRSTDLHVWKVISSRISAHSSMKGSSEWIGRGNNYSSMLKNMLIAVIRRYQKYLSPDHSLWAKAMNRPPYCKHIPSCSDYMIEVIEKKWAIVGLGRWLARIGRCNPWSQGGYDPVEK